jgi:hypothetical protein
MSDDSPPTDTSRLQDILNETLLRADQLRIAGQGKDALMLLKDVQPVANDLGFAARARHALSTASTLTEQAGFGGFDTWEERLKYLETALTDAQQTDDLALLGAIWDTRGMSLHQQYLDTSRTAEPPEELSSFERGLSYRQQVADQHGIAKSLFHIGLVYDIVRQDHKTSLPFLQ